MTITGICRLFVGTKVCFKFLFKKRDGAKIPQVDVGNLIISEVLIKGTKAGGSKEHYITMTKALEKNRAAFYKLKLTKVSQLKKCIHGLYLSLSSSDTLGGQPVKLSQAQRVLHVFTDTFEEILKRGDL